MNHKNLNKHCDEALTELASGNTNALTVIYENMGRRIFFVCLSVLGDKESAEDAMQDTLLRLATEAKHYSSGTNALAFILTVARNISLNILEKRKRDTTLMQILEADTKTVFDNTCELTVGTLEALNILDERDRQIVTMRLDGKMKHRDIAAVLNISVAACQKCYRRALEKLKIFYS